jgi:hypothetical protein
MMSLDWEGTHGPLSAFVRRLQAVATSDAIKSEAELSVLNLQAVANTTSIFPAMDPQENCYSQKGSGVQSYRLQAIIEILGRRQDEDLQL